jgi:hypothetical protein
VEQQVNEAIAGLPVSRVIEQQPYFNMLIYGNSGAGKTRLAGSAAAVPDLRRILFIDVEGGTLTLRNTPYNEVEVVRVKSWQDMELVYNELYANPTQFNTVIVDSLTEIQKMSMDRVMRRLVEENEERDGDVPGMREWNINIEQTRKFVRKFRDLPVNTIFTALETTEKDMRKGSLKRKPSLSGKVKDEVAAFLDIVVYLYIKEVGDENKRILLTGQTEDTVAKDRSNQLPMIIEDPTMEAIYGYLTKEISANVA